MATVGSNPKNLDFKIGARTAFKFDKGLLGAQRHKILDSEKYSTSSKYGFRLEGATDVEEIVHKAKQNPKTSHYKKTINMFKFNHIYNNIIIL